MSPSVEKNVELVRAGYEAINREGPDAAQRFMDPGIVLDMPQGLIDAGSYHGREALMRVWHAYFDEFDEFRWDVERLFGVDERVFLRVRERGRGRQSGAEVDWQRWWVYTLRDGLIVRAEFYADEASALEAMGLGGDAPVRVSSSDEAPIAQPDRATPS
jgi:ketosteroid isomerase-like protein